MYAWPDISFFKRPKGGGGWMRVEGLVEDLGGGREGESGRGEEERSIIEREGRYRRTKKKKVFNRPGKNLQHVF